MTAADYQAITVPSGSGWADGGAPFVLPATVAAALDRARGALVRTVYRLLRDEDALVALGYHRPGTAQEKLTALSGDPGLLAELTDRVAEQLAEAGAVSLKLELPAEAEAWHRAAREAGFVPLRTPLAPTAPGATEAVPAGFVRRLGGWTAAELPYYRQSTDFTCGPVAALTAASGLGLAPRLDRPAEVRFWREATSAPGCDGYGLAAVLAERGVVAELVVNTSEALQVEAEPSAWQRDLRTFLQDEFRARAQHSGVPIRLAEVSIAELFGLVASGRLVVLLIDEELMHAEPCPHWVVLHGVHDGIGLIEDPWTDADLGETWVDAHQLPVTADALAAMAGWNGYRSVLVLPQR